MNPDGSDPYAVSPGLLLCFPSRDSFPAASLFPETSCSCDLLVSCDCMFACFPPHPVTPHSPHAWLPQEPKRRGIFRTVDSGNSLTTFALVDRIINHRQKFIERNQAKEQKELKMMAVLQSQSNGSTESPQKQRQQQQPS